jgi:CheY-like chemotaxis protein
MRFLDDSGSTLSTPVLRAIPAPREQPAAPDRATMEAHLARSRYGGFTLTEAIRPGWHLDVVPQAGFRHDAYVDPRTGARMPAVIAAVSSEDLFATFLDLLEPLGDSCDVVLESTHDSATNRRELTREGVERLVLESMLEFEGAEVVFVSNGQEAVDAMQKNDATGYHAVLMDVQMPVMDGLEATRRITALNTGVPVIGLTAHALEEERARCRDAGMVAHVAKPVEIDELVVHRITRARKS